MKLRYTTTALGLTIPSALLTALESVDRIARENRETKAWRPRDIRF